MTVSPNGSLSSINEMNEESVARSLREMEGRICELQTAAKIARYRSRIASIKYPITHCRVLYLVVAQFMREEALDFLGWRWAVVLIGTVATSGLFIVIFMSWGAGLFGVIIGAVAFTSFVAFPSDLRLKESMNALSRLLAESELLREREGSNFSKIGKELAAARELQSQTINQSEKHRQSRQCKLSQLAAKNWRAMRGEDLEIFLEEVFVELRYSVDRKGGSGDQGVDLIVEKNGWRIALQVKGYLNSVPNTAIQEAHTGMVFYKCDACAVVTNSRFTSGGKNIAAKVGCVLVDEDVLPTLIMGQVDLHEETLAARI